MKKPRYAVAMELRKADKDLNEKFHKLDEKSKWEWLIYATRHEPYMSLNYARQLVQKGNDMSKSELFDLAAQKKGETDRAFRLFDGKVTEWVPKSQVEENGDGTYTMPEWLAKEKGFI